MNFDAVIRGGTVVTAEHSRELDVGIAGGRIAALAAGLPAGAREIDARGKLVLPEMVNIADQDVQQ